VPTDDGHEFAFGASALTGSLVVEERGHVGSAPRLPALLQVGHQIPEIYKIVAKTADVPDALLAAAAGSVQIASDLPPPYPGAPIVPPLPTSSPRIQSFTLTGNQTWFLNNVCPGNNPAGHGITRPACLLEDMAINPTLFFYVTETTGYFQAAVVDQNASAANMIAFFWDGSEWIQDWTSDPIYPGDWMYQIWGDSGLTYRSTTLLEQGIDGDPGGLAIGSCCR
jgi:hypothetical protein